MSSRSPLVLASVLGVAALALLATGCGGGSPAGVASVGTSTSAAPAGQSSGLVAYARCMRSHGVATFPDPDSSGGIPKRQVVAARTGDPSRFDSAESACRHLLPDGSLAAPQTPQQTATQVADGLSFARCMRSHGVARFPDPTAQGQLTVEMVRAEGIDLHAPAVLRAVTACLPASHGLLTPAKVREALTKAGG